MSCGGGGASPPPAALRLVAGPEGRASEAEPPAPPPPRACAERGPGAAAGRAAAGAVSEARSRRRRRAVPALRAARGHHSRQQRLSTALPRLASPHLTERPGACRPAPPEQPRAVAVMMNRFRKWLYKPKVSGSGGLRDDKARRRLALCPSSSPALPPRPPHPLFALLPPLRPPLPPSRAPEAAHSLLLSRRYRDSAVASTSSPPLCPCPLSSPVPSCCRLALGVGAEPLQPPGGHSPLGAGGLAHGQKVEAWFSGKSCGLPFFFSCRRNPGLPVGEGCRSGGAAAERKGEKIER